MWFSFIKLFHFKLKLQGSNRRSQRDEKFNKRRDWNLVLADAVWWIIEVEINFTRHSNELARQSLSILHFIRSSTEKNLNCNMKSSLTGLKRDSPSILIIFFVWPRVCVRRSLFFGHNFGTFTASVHCRFS